MSWWGEPLLREYYNHLLKYHQDQGIYELDREMNFQEEFLVYTKFAHRDTAQICCDFCDWALKFSVSYILSIEK